MESVNISTTDEFAVFSCEAVGSSILSLEWRVLANRSLSELGARVATQGGNNSICSNLTLSVAVLYELSSQAPLKVICNVSQTSVLPAGTGTVHTYIISEGYIFFLLTPSLRAALPEGTGIYCSVFIWLFEFTVNVQNAMDCPEMSSGPVANS